MLKSHLLEDLCAHVSAGRLGTAAHDRLFELMRAFPEGCSAGGATVWRAVSIAPEKAERLAKGEPVRLEVSAHSCWTTEFTAALGIARIRFIQEDDRAMVILRGEAPKGARSLDVKKCFRWLEADNPEVFVWQRYAQFEAEVIVANDLPFIDIDPGNVEDLWLRNGCEFDAMRPRVGETFLEDGLQVIEEVLGLNDCGCVEVRVGETIYPLVADAGIYSPSCLVLGGAPRPCGPALEPQ